MRWQRGYRVSCAGIVLAYAATALGQYSARQNVPVEIQLKASRHYSDPFNDVDLDVEFTEPSGIRRRVPAFWDGGSSWRVRYASPTIGRHRFRSICSNPLDPGLNGIKGSVVVQPYAGSNPLYAHGPIRVADDGRHLAYADGKPFFWLGDTWWMGLAKRLRWPEEFKTLTADRVAKGFNVVQIAAGLYPEMYPFDPRGANEAGYPWEANYARINPAYFDRADARIRYLVDRGITPCIVGAWGFYLPMMGEQRMRQHWRYLIARYGSLPVVWCAAGEANLPWYLAKGFPYDDRDQARRWTEIARYIKQADPFHRLLTVHPTAIDFYTARHAIDDDSLLDFDMLQTPHGREDAARVALRAAQDAQAAAPSMPWLDGEAAYEMLIDPKPTEWARVMFWICMLNGAAGHTYGANGIWENNRPGDPHGKNPNGYEHPSIPWQDAMHLPGAEQIGNAKRLFEKFPWQSFRPHPEWAAYADGPDSIPPQAAGIAGGVRIVYMLRPKPATMVHLQPGKSYRVTRFDPLTGVSSPGGDAIPDAEGNWTAVPPAGADHDWALVLQPESASPKSTSRVETLTLENQNLAVTLNWPDGRLRTSAFENRLSGHRIPVISTSELTLAFSAKVDQVADPIERVSGFSVSGFQRIGGNHAVFAMRSADGSVKVLLHYLLAGAQLRKWAEIQNVGTRNRLLLDVELDDFTSGAGTSGGGMGQPVFLDDEMYAAIEHPAGDDVAESGHVRLGQHPGRLLASGSRFTSFTAVLGVGRAGMARDAFLAYITARSLRPKEDLSIYTPFGINNQWGAAASLDDEEVLDVLGLLRGWRSNGTGFDYFTMDAGWVDPDSDLTKFRTAAFPNGPDAIVNLLPHLGMRFGLWFAMEWGAQSAWDYPSSYANGVPPELPYREGYPLTAGGVTLCLGTSRYYNMLKSAVLYHVRHNRVRLLKFDGGVDPCSDPTHDHLPGKYSLELKYDRLIDIAASARKLAPDVFVMWYWGLRSPFWALYGSTIFDSGFHLEGSGTSSTPTLFYRDSVTIAQDQAAQYAPNIPPVVKDSLGVWISENRWGNFMGKERWREAAIMDLGRGNLLFPNLWGNLYSFDAGDQAFLKRFHALAKDLGPLLVSPRRPVGDVWKSGPYGYAYAQGSRGVLFLNNPSFEAKPLLIHLDRAGGFAVEPGTPVSVVSEFPERARLAHSDGAPYRIGETATVWLRPCETLMLRVEPAIETRLPLRRVDEGSALRLGQRLVLTESRMQHRLNVRFADAGAFERQGFIKKTLAFDVELPDLRGPQPILAMSVRLRRRGEDWKYRPKPVQIVQAMAMVGTQKIQLIPMPDGRQFGNTQSDGSSWIVYKVRLNPADRGRILHLAVHAYLPSDVSPTVEGWIVHRWWQESHRPQGDGYYTDAPS